MTIAERVVQDFNSLDHVIESFTTIVRRHIRKWNVQIDLEGTERGTLEIQIFQFEDGSLAIVPDMANATAIDPSFPASERLL